MVQLKEFKGVASARRINERRRPTHTLTAAANEGLSCTRAPHQPIIHILRQDAYLPLGAAAIPCILLVAPSPGKMLHSSVDMRITFVN